VESSVLTEKKSGPHRFQVGNPGGPGRPKKVQEEAYLHAIRRALPPDELEDLIRRLAASNSWRANLAAGELALHYGVGKPVQRVQVSSDGLQGILAVLDGR
jgi:hypothetical protein